MTNPRHKERHYGRNARDLIDIGLKAMDKVEKGKSFFEALGEAFGDVRQKRSQEEAEHPVGPGMPIGFRSREVGSEREVTATATYMKDGIPYCAAHDIPFAVCSMCKGRGDK
jgi:hypothetical protein